MRKYLSKILISVFIAAFFLAPFSSDMRTKEAMATDLCEINFGLLSTETASDGVRVKVQVWVNPGRQAKDENNDGKLEGKTWIPVTGAGCWGSKNSVSGELNAWNSVISTIVSKNANGEFLLPDKIFFIDIGTDYDPDPSLTSLKNPIKNIVVSVPINPNIAVESQTLERVINLPKSKNPYYVSLRLEESGSPFSAIQPAPGKPGYPRKIILPEDNSKINEPGAPTQTILGKTESSEFSDFDFQCGIIGDASIMGCVAELSYAIWAISAMFAQLAGKFLDFFIYYATNSSSYTNTFVSQGWGAVRDVANIFFIIALLYIAIQMVLSLDSHHSKKTLSYIIVIALIINFSLFTTKVVIDASNILAKVFYNSIQGVDSVGNPVIGDDGQKSISVGLIDKFNPQKIITQNNYNVVGATQFTFITLLLLMITLYTAFIFFSVALLFVARVASLWIAMIFAPLAFASYTVPFDVPGFGHKKWWPNLLQNAFMAPLFVFFLYVIVMFTKFLPSVASYPDGTDMFQHIMSVIIPFIILMVLLHKAKNIAVEYAGEMGKGVMKVAGVAGGIAAGGAIGVTAAGLQGSLGHIGKMAFESKTLQDWETNKDNGLKRFVGKTLRTTAGGDDGKGGFAGSSFDLRKGLGGGALKAASAITGLNLGGNSKFLLRDGGYEADLKRRDAKRKARAEGLKVKEGESEKQHLNEIKEQQQTVSLGNEHDLHELDNKIKAATGKRQTLRALAESTANKGRNEDGTFKDPLYAQRMKDFQDSAAEVASLEQEKRDIKNGAFNKATGQYRTHNGKIAEKTVEKARKEAASAGEALVEAENKLDKAVLDDAEAKRAEAEAVSEAAAAEAEVTKATREAAFGPSGDTSRAAAVTAANAAKAAADAKVSKAQSTSVVASENLANRTRENALAEDRARTANEIASRANEAARGGTGHSQNDFEDELTPEAEHHLKEANDTRIRNFADIEQNKFSMPWNKAARRKSAHEIRMGVKADKHGGGGHGGGSHFGDALVAEFVGGKIFGGGHDKGHDDHGGDHAADHGGGGDHH